MINVRVTMRQVAPPDGYVATVQRMPDGAAVDSEFSLRLDETLVTVDAINVSCATFIKSLDFLRAVHLQRLGEILFQRIFTGEAGAFLKSLWREATAQGLRLFVEHPPVEEVPLLTVLPYEFLTDNAATGFWFRGQKHRLIRKLRALETEALPTGRRMLLLTANPTLGKQVKPFNEEAGFAAVFKSMRAAGFRVTPHRHVTRDDLRALVMSYATRPGPHFEWLHFLGHGGVDGSSAVLYLEREGGAAEPITAAQFSSMIAPLGVKIAFLQACSSGVAPRPYSGVAQSLLQPAGGNAALVLATLAPVGFERSTRYAEVFYQQMRFTNDIDTARQSALSIYTEEEAEWGLISLFGRATDLQPTRAMTNGDLADLRHEVLVFPPVKLLILDIVGTADLSVEIADANDIEDTVGLVATLLQLKFAHVILAPAAARDDARWRANFLAMCKIAIDNLNDGLSLRNAMHHMMKVKGYSNKLMPVFCVADSFEEVR